MTDTDTNQDLIYLHINKMREMMRTREDEPAIRADMAFGIGYVCGLELCSAITVLQRDDAIKELQRAADLNVRLLDTEVTG